MSRRDCLVLGVWCAAVLALLAPVWARPGAAFLNHGDLYAYHVPLRHFSAEALQQGRLPFWNPYILLGLPHAANPQSVLFYPISLLGFFWPAVPALVWDQVFHLLWAGAGLFLLARSQGLSRGGAAVLASAYALSPFLVYRVTAGIPTLLAALAWAPWLWLSWLSGPPGLLAAAWALQFFSGHAQFLVVNAAGMGLWALARGPRGALLGRLMREGGLAFLLAALQWVLTAQFLALSVRASWSGAASPAYALPPRALLAFLWPGLWGAPTAGTWDGVVSVFYETCGGWIGPAALAFTVWGAARGKNRAAPLALAAAGVLLALGPAGPLGPLLGLPGLSFLRAPARWLFLSVWGALLLAGAGLAAWRGPRGVLAAAALLGFAVPALWDAPFLRPQDPAPFLAPRPGIAESLSGRPSRVLTNPELANPNKTMLYHARNVNGYEAFYLSGVPAWAAAAQGGPAADASRVYVSRWPSAALARAGVAARLSESGLERAPAWPLAAFVDASGRRLAPDPDVELPRPERWRVSGLVPAGAAALELSQPAYPGWRARVGGAPAVVEPRGLFLALPLGRGAQGARLDLALDFLPTGWPWLVLASAAAWAVWLAAFLRRAEAA